MSAGASSVSVLIPCFNAAPYLEATLASVLAQTEPALEILVVDDGSTDGSQEIAARHQRVTPLRNPGKGASAARNFASTQARGAFFQYLDADDLLDPDALRSRRLALETTGADVAISDWRRLHLDGTQWRDGRTESGRLPEPEASADVQVLNGFWAPPAAILYRKATTFDRVDGGWQEHLPVIQDARFLFDVANAGARFVHVPTVGASYRQHQQGSLSTAGTTRFWGDVLQNARDAERVWQKDGSLDHRRRTVLAGVYGNCVRAAFGRDRELFEESHRELLRLPMTSVPRRTRLISRLVRLLGYDGAWAALSRLGLS